MWVAGSPARSRNRGFQRIERRLVAYARAKHVRAAWRAGTVDVRGDLLNSRQGAGIERGYQLATACVCQIVAVEKEVPDRLGARATRLVPPRCPSEGNGPSPPGRAIGGVGGAEPPGQ